MIKQKGKSSFIQLAFSVVIAISLFGCAKPDPRPLIVLSKKYDDHRFDKWLLNSPAAIKIVGLYGQAPDSIEYYIANASGVILTGGNDINPGQYGKPDEVDRCGKIDLLRDSIETEMLTHALSKNIPILGICRGHQMLNVICGGTLIIDIPTDYDTLVIHRGEGPEYVEHKVILDQQSNLFRTCNRVSGMVKSKHHQAVAELGTNLVEAAASIDGLIEAVEIKDTTVHPFAVGVQWHPELMEINHEFSGKLLNKFIRKATECRKEQLSI